MPCFIYLDPDYAGQDTERWCRRSVRSAWRWWRPARAGSPPGSRREPNANHCGVVYAGSLFSVAEVLGGLIARTTFPLPGFVPIIKRAEVAYHRPATSSVRADASLPEEEHVRIPTEAQERGKADYALAVEVTDEQGEPVATLAEDYQLRRR